MPFTINHTTGLPYTKQTEIPPRSAMSISGQREGGGGSQDLFKLRNAKGWDMELGLRSAGQGGSSIEHDQLLNFKRPSFDDATWGGVTVAMGLLQLSSSSTISQ